MTCYYWFWCTPIAVFFVLLYLWFLAYVKVSWTHILSCLFVYSSFASIDCSDIVWSVCLISFRFVMCWLHDISFVMPVIPPTPLWLLDTIPGHGLPWWALRSLLPDKPHSVGLLWTSDQLIAETTWQHTTLTTDKHACPRRDSNPHSQQASGLRYTP